jgi:fumarylacetoacetase
MAVNGFGIANLPYGVFRHRDQISIGVAFGDRILNLRTADTGGLPPETREACTAPRLNELMSLGRPRWRELRAHVTELLTTSAPELIPMSEVAMQLPAEIGDYTDFYASLHHATNVGHLFRPDNPLLPNYKWVPIGYHGRASSIIPSGTPVRRPSGQVKDADKEAPRFGPTRSLDYELELGFFIGPGNSLGAPIPIDAAEDQIFGVCLVNDWSARDIQAWEYQPLGPFLGKSFATSISPWVVTMEALEPYRVSPPPRAAGDPEPLPYLRSAGQKSSGVEIAGETACATNKPGGAGIQPAGLRPRAASAFDVTLEVELTSARMRAEGIAPMRLSRGNASDLYWTPAQLIAHHTSNGCNLRPGDLLASGTVSGASRESMGCLLEITRRGAEPLALPTGEIRPFLEDGDEITLRGWCERGGFPRISLGACTGRVAG